MDVVNTLVSLSAAAAVVAACVMLIAYKLRHWQDAIIYHPNSPENSTSVCAEPSDFGIAQYEPLCITTSDGVSLRGYLVHPPHDPPVTCSNHSVHGGTLIYFHGNAGNVGHRLPIAKLLSHSLYTSVLMVDYRGYGLSDTVTPTEEGLKLDAYATLDFVIQHPKLSKEKVFLFGTSLGGAVAVHLASRPEYAKHIAGTILENTFTSISDMADALFSPMIQRAFPRSHWVLVPFLQHVVKPLVLFVGWWSVDTIRKVPSPILFLSGAKDELVPPSHMKRLHDVVRVSKKAEFVSWNEFTHGKHNDLFTAKGYTNVIEAFLKEALLRRRKPELAVSKREGEVTGQLP